MDRSQAVGSMEMEVTVIYEIDHSTAFGPCSARGISPSSLLVLGQRK